jgi:hypothetical protein
VRRFKVDGLKNHAKTLKHVAAVKLNANKNTLAKKIDSIWFSFHPDLLKLIKCVKFCLDHDFSIVKFRDLCQFLGVMGTKFKTSLYQTEYGFMEILISMSTILKKELLKRLKRSIYFSIMIDESTDVANVKELAIMVKYFDEEDLMVRTEFLSLIKLEESDADTISKSILLLFEACDLYAYNLIGISTDGAAVMVGEKSGVCQKLFRYAPFLIQTHCVAHRLNLAFRDSEKPIQELEVINKLALDIYKYFKYSAVKTKQLERYAKIRKRKVYKILKLYDIVQIQCIREPHKEL